MHCYEPLLTSDLYVQVGTLYDDLIRNAKVRATVVAAAYA